MLLACLLAFAGCAAPPAAPAPLTLRIAAVPSMRPAADALATAYEALEQNTVVEVSEGRHDEVLAAVGEGKADLALVEEAVDDASLLDPDTWHRRLHPWPLALDQVAVIVHPSNPVRGLSSDQLCRVYEGLERRWDGLGGPDEPIHLVSREPGAQARLAFDAAILQGQLIAGTAVVLPSDQAVVDYVAENPGAVGYVSAAWVGDSVRAIAVDGALPGATNTAYPLTHPVYVVTAIGPAGKVRAFLQFCRSGPGRDALARFYVPN